MNPLRHTAISASAGSGKTYQLTHRFILLLHLCERPDRIIALTFTRNAAGEFFHKIVEKLCDAAESEDAAARLSEELGIEAGTGRYRQLLELLVRNLHRLNLQTVDSFLYRVVSAFALELGLSGSISLLDETAAPRAHRDVRDAIVHRPGAPGAELEEFWHAFRQATHGQEPRGVESLLEGFIGELYPLFLESPDPRLWGDPDTLWPGGCPWKTAAETDWDALADALLAAVPEGLAKQQAGDFATAAAKVRAYPAEEDLNTLLRNALESADAIFDGRAAIKVRRKEVELGGRTCAALADILRAVLWHHLSRALGNARGVHGVLRAYHKEYDRLVRRPGRVDFADLTRLLAPPDAGEPLLGAGSEARELMDYRLDGRFDHWLFDEFQDTSRAQWRAVANLVDEVVQDAGGERSLFYVGDTKQCLYLWRNGDDRLFHQVHEAYRPRIELQSLATSWRSAPAVLDGVNAVFDDGPAIAESFSAGAAARWERAWQPHAPSPATRDLDGYACWLQADADEGPDRNALLLDLIERLDPAATGMSVGVLVRRNDDAADVAAYLRAHSALPVHTGSAVRPASDNAAGTALLALLRLAAHPGDGLARGFLRLVEAGAPGPSLTDRVSELRRTLLLEGAERGVREAAGLVGRRLPGDDRHHRDRLDALVDAARRFDAEEQRDLDGLCDFLQDTTLGQASAGESVVVETVHKAKGLEYDVVLLVEEQKSNRPDTAIQACRDEAGEAEWILEPLRRDLASTDPLLAAQREQIECDRDFGALCVLYVAMTRARRGLYIVSPPVKGAHDATPLKFLAARFGQEVVRKAIFPGKDFPVVWDTGNPEWIRSFRAPPPEQAASGAADELPDFGAAHPRFRLDRPSAGTADGLKAGALFRIDNRALGFGTRVHAAFEAVEWIDAGESLESGSSDEAAAVVRTCLEEPSIRTLFTRPEEPHKLWREKAFALVDGERLVSGTFDRVVLHRGPADGFTSAGIVDFKTDRIHEGNTIEQAAAHHRAQMEAYRRALAALTGLPEDAISMTLVFTDVPVAVRLD